MGLNFVLMHGWDGAGNKISNEINPAKNYFFFSRKLPLNEERLIMASPLP